MAATPEGRAWVIKALHPSDPICDVRGIPDESSCPTVLLTYNSVFRAQAPGIAGQTTWGYDLTVIPDVINQASLVITEATGLPVALASKSFLNQGLRPAGVLAPTYAQLLSQWEAMGIEAFRLVYMGVTAYQDGPALSNQGTLVASQWEAARRKFCFVPPAGVVTASYGTYRGVRYQASDFADYATSQYMPNAYFGESKEGCYLPLKLTNTSQKWTTAADLEYPVNSWGYSANGSTITVPIATQPSSQPYYSLVSPSWTVAAGQMSGDAVYRPLNGIFGGISARNLSVDTAFAFYFRVGIECRVQPSSLMASQVHMSPPYDPLAIASYYRINRELKDAYPADFNDLGKIWDVIKQVASVALPVIGGMGPVGLAASTVGSALIGAIDAKSSRKKSQQGNAKGSDQPSAAVIDRARKEQVVRDAAATSKARQPKPQRKAPKKQKKQVARLQTLPKKTLAKMAAAGLLP